MAAPVPITRALRRPLPPAPPASGPVLDREATLDALDEIAARVLTPAEQLARIADLKAGAERAQQRLARARAVLACGVCAAGAASVSTLPEGA
jgi:hypothetical protein